MLFVAAIPLLAIKTLRIARLPPRLFTYAATASFFFCAAGDRVGGAIVAADKGPTAEVVGQEEEEEEGPREEGVEKRPRKPGACTGLATPVGKGQRGGRKKGVRGETNTLWREDATDPRPIWD
jgi:hypothetical protein